MRRRVEICCQIDNDMSDVICLKEIGLLYYPIADIDYLAEDLYQSADLAEEQVSFYKMNTATIGDGRHSINFVNTSPDGQWLAICLDMHFLYLIDLRPIPEISQTHDYPNENISLFAGYLFKCVN